METMDFEQATAVEPAGEGTFRVEVPDGWQQGRGAYGGWVLATLLRAIERSEPDRGRATRTLSGDLCGPVLSGRAEIRVRVLRRGNNQSNLAAELWQNGKVQATATAVLSTPRKVALAAPPLDAPPPERAEDSPLLPVTPPGAPAFVQHFEFRSRLPRPFGPTTRAAVNEGWLRERVPLARLDAPAIIGRVDAWWPTAGALMTEPRPMATIAFTAELLADPATLPPTEPLRYRARMLALNDGFFVELRELWLGARPVAFNQQTFVIIK